MKHIHYCSSKNTKRKLVKVIVTFPKFVSFVSSKRSKRKKQFPVWKKSKKKKRGQKLTIGSEKKIMLLVNNFHSQIFKETGVMLRQNVLWCESYSYAIQTILQVQNKSYDKIKRNSKHFEGTCLKSCKNHKAKAEKRKNLTYKLVCYCWLYFFVIFIYQF